jgi:hypothetical protein
MMADAAIVGERLGSVAEWGDRVCGALADRLAAEGERRLLWLPVFFGSGIGIYFVLRVEPPLWPGIAAAVAGAAAAWALRIFPAWREVMLAFTALAAGFALMPRLPGSATRRWCSATSGRSPSAGGSSIST